MENKDIKNLYELTFWISPDFKDEEAQNYFEKIKTYIQDANGEIKKELKPTKKKLAYKIGKKIYGYLSTLYFYFNPNDIKKFEKKLKSEIDILRFLIIKVNKHHLRLIEEKIPPSKIIKTKPDEEKKEEKIEGKVKLEELDKKLEEILGKEF